MAQNTDWASRIFCDSTLIKGFWNNLLDEDEDQAVDAMRRNKDGETLTASRFPSEFFVKRSGKSFRSFPEIFNAGGFWVVTGRTAEVLRQFDLGQTSLYPTKFFKYDRKTPFERDFFCINFGEKKDAFVPELSTAEKKPWMDTDIWKRPVYPKDDQLVLSPAALEGPLRFEGLEVDPVTRTAKRQGETLELTSTEFDLLLLLARAPAQVHSRDDILATLRGHDADLYTRAVDIVVSRLRKKLEPLDCIRTVRHAGYALALPPLTS